MLMSYDKRYFIKTLVTEEVEQMHHLLKQYHQVNVRNVFFVWLGLISLFTPLNPPTVSGH